MHIHEATDYLLGVDADGGPEHDSYAGVDAAVSTIMAALRSGLLSRAALERMWADMPNAFGADTLMGHGLRKPYGYAGDFEMIDRIYQRSVTVNPSARRWDEYFQSRPACVAVRNRRDYFLARMAGCVGRGRRTAVLNVASGPARDVAEFLGGSGLARDVEIDCIDLDAAAIAHAEGLCREHGGGVRFHHANVFHWRARRRYDLIWSAGLFDYLDDRAFVTLIKHLAPLLEPEGCMVIGNFSPANPTRDFMEFGEWFLNYRDEGALLELGAEPARSGCRVWVEREPCGINLFLNVQRDRTVPGGVNR